MSTRSSIAIKRKDGKVESIYCHSDGYLEYNGVMLNNFYRDINKINSLINLGDISFLDRMVNPDPTAPHGFDYDKRQNGVTVAYGRDRNEKNVDKKIFNNIDDYIKTFDDTWQEFAYLFDEEKNTWLWTAIPYDKNKEVNFEQLEDQLIKMNLVEKVDDKLLNILNEEVQFLKKFDLETYSTVYESDEDAKYNFTKLFSEPEGIVMEMQVLYDYLFDLDTNSYFASMSDTEIEELKGMAKILIEDLNVYGKEKFKSIRKDPCKELDEK